MENFEEHALNFLKNNIVNVDFTHIQAHYWSKSCYISARTCMECVHNIYQNVPFMILNVLNLRLKYFCHTKLYICYHMHQRYDARWYQLQLDVVIA